MWLAGIGRRPTWIHTHYTEDVINANLFLARLHFEEQPDTSFLRADVNVLAEQAKNFGKEFYAMIKHSKITPGCIAAPMMQIECDAQAQFEPIQPSI